MLDMIMAQICIASFIAIYIPSSEEIRTYLRTCSPFT